MGPQIQHRSEQRATEKLELLWTSMRRQHSIPCISDLRIDVDTAAWDPRFLLKEDKDAARSVFILCGQSAAALFPTRTIAQPLIEMVPYQLSRLMCSDFGTVLQGQNPTRGAGSIFVQDQEVFFRYILLPMSSCSPGLGYILGALTSTLQTKSDRLADIAKDLIFRDA